MTHLSIWIFFFSIFHKFRHYLWIHSLQKQNLVIFHTILLKKSSSIETYDDFDHRIWLIILREICDTIYILFQNLSNDVHKEHIRRNLLAIRTSISHLNAMQKQFYMTPIHTIPLMNNFEQWLRRWMRVWSQFTMATRRIVYEIQLVIKLNSNVK